MAIGDEFYDHGVISPKAAIIFKGYSYVVPAELQTLFINMISQITFQEGMLLGVNSRITSLEAQIFTLESKLQEHISNTTFGSSRSLP